MASQDFTAITPKVTATELEANKTDYSFPVGRSGQTPEAISAEALLEAAGSGGTGTPASEASYATTLDDVADLGNSWVKLGLDTASVNEGSFTVTSDRVVVPSAGRYKVHGHVDGSTTGSGSSNRARIAIRFAVTNAAGTTTTAREAVGRSYARAQYTGFHEVTADVDELLDLADGESVELQAQAVEQNTGDTMSVDGSASDLTLFKVGGSGGGAELPATVTQAEAEAGTVTSTRMWTPERVKQAIAALATGGTGGATWTTGTATPSGGSDGDWYLRTGNTDPGIYNRAGGAWSRILTPGDPDQTGAEIVTLLDALTGAARLQGTSVRNLITAINADSGAIDADHISADIARDSEVVSAVGAKYAAASNWTLGSGGSRTLTVTVASLPASIPGSVARYAVAVVELGSGGADIKIGQGSSSSPAVSVAANQTGVVQYKVPGTQDVVLTATDTSGGTTVAKVRLDVYYDLRHQTLPVPTSATRGRFLRQKAGSEEWELVAQQAATARVPYQSGPPFATGAGQLYFDSDNTPQDGLQVYNGTQWVPVVNAKFPTGVSADRGKWLRHDRSTPGLVRYVDPPMSWRGGWSNGATYYRGDVVSHNSKLYVVTSAYTVAGITGSGAPDTDTANWTELAAGSGSGAATLTEQTFYTHFDDDSSVATSWEDASFQAADVEVSQGTFTIASDKVAVSVAGRYYVNAHADGTANGSSSLNRARLYVRIGRTTGPAGSRTTTYEGGIGRDYARSQYTGFYSMSSDTSAVLDLAVGDEISVQVQCTKQSSSDTVTLNGSESSLTLILLGGIKGDKGDSGTAAVTISGTPPVGPSDGDTWWDTTGNPDAGLKVRVGSNWVSVGGTMTGTQIVTALNANGVTGQITAARLGTGTPSASNYLRGDGSWAAVSASGGGPDRAEHLNLVAVTLPFVSTARGGTKVNFNTTDGVQVTYGSGSASILGSLASNQVSVVAGIYLVEMSKGFDPVISTESLVWFDIYSGSTTTILASSNATHTADALAVDVQLSQFAYLRLATQTNIRVGLRSTVANAQTRAAGRLIFHRLSAGTGASFFGGTVARAHVESVDLAEPLFVDPGTDVAGVRSITARFGNVSDGSGYRIDHIATDDTVTNLAFSSGSTPASVTRNITLPTQVLAAAGDTCTVRVSTLDSFNVIQDSGFGYITAQDLDHWGLLENGEDETDIVLGSADDHAFQPGDTEAVLTGVPADETRRIYLALIGNRTIEIHMASIDITHMFTRTQNVSIDSRSYTVYILDADNAVDDNANGLAVEVTPSA